VKKIGFLIGHAAYLPQARALAASIIEHTSLTREYQLEAVSPEHLALVVDIPGVVSRTFMLPEPYRSIPFVDKMLAASAFERQCGDGYIWLDVDSYFLRDIAFPAAGAVFVNSVDMKNIGDGYGGERSPIWRLLNAYFGLADAQPPVVTGVSGEKIYAYFNVGLVLVNEPKISLPLWSWRSATCWRKRQSSGGSRRPGYGRFSFIRRFSLAHCSNYMAGGSPLYRAG
jgi:hypothetical protein